MKIGLKVGTLTLLFGASTVVAIRHAIKYGWLAGNTYCLTHRFKENPNKWYL